MCWLHELYLVQLLGKLQKPGEVAVTSQDPQNRRMVLVRGFVRRDFNAVKVGVGKNNVEHAKDGIEYLRALEDHLDQVLVAVKGCRGSGGLVQKEDVHGRRRGVGA